MERIIKKRSSSHAQISILCQKVGVFFLTSVWVEREKDSSPSLVQVTFGSNQKNQGFWINSCLMDEGTSQSDAGLVLSRTFQLAKYKYKTLLLDTVIKTVW